MHQRRLVAFVLVLALLTSCACVAVFASTAEDWDRRWDDAVKDETVIAMSPGADDGEMRFSWLSGVKSGNRFRFGTSPEIDEMRDAAVSEKRTLTRQIVCRVAVDGLTPDTDYYYAYTKDGVWSEVYAFRTQGEQLTALFVSDAQIGRSGDWRDRSVLLHDTAGWDTTLSQATSLYPDISLCLSAGDQTEKGFSEQQYRLFLAPDALRSMPIATTVGNHEFYFPYLFYHFNLPNRFGGSIVHSLSDEPYYFTKSNVLFIVLDSNDLLAIDHERVLDEAIRAYPDAKWQVVMMHHSLYSCEDSDAKGPLLRRTLAPIFQKYGVDLVLSGHTHRYSRSLPICDGKFADSGVTYLEGGCSSACNSKACPDSTPSYTAAGYKKGNVPVYTLLQFTDDAIRVRAYAVEDGESVEMDRAEVLPNPQETPKSMSVVMRFLQTALSGFGRAISLLFR